LRSDRAYLEHAILLNLQVHYESAQRLSEERKKHTRKWTGAHERFQNVLVHDYFGVDFGIVWWVVERDVPALEAAVTDHAADDEGSEPH